MSKVVIELTQSEGDGDRINVGVTFHGGLDESDSVHALALKLAKMLYGKDGENLTISEGGDRVLH